MNDHCSPTSPSADRLVQVLDGYLAAVQAGTAPDRQEFLARHPELADELRECLASLEFIRRAAVGPAPAELTAAAEPPAGVLGDFRLLREVGRGGMGIVYEADQISLGRRVALKVLPFASTLDPRQLQRFHNEARAAAGLHHTHIVPVYATGSERGVHYYAMQFIDGRTLADLIQQRRRGAVAAEPTGPNTPAPAVDTPPAARATQASARDPDHFRTVARLGVQAAGALEHAHQLGVVHRDVKPANLMVDDRGHLWVTDFGLAHCQSQAGLTLTGDLVGTLRYMSPEQALARQVPVDHRTDVYSLGATLYELVTLEPAVPGNDRQELLRRIAAEDPKPPRRLNRAVPAELETVILKAVEKAPQDRYGTAQELADDLRRWLDDRPIQARRPSWARVAAKWARRHKPLVGAMAVVLLMAALLGGGTALWWAQKRAGAEGEARAALGDAVGLLEQERWPEALSAARHAEGALAGVGADPRLRQQAHELVEDLEMAQRLQEARLLGAAEKDGYFDLGVSDAAYALAFAEYGFDVDRLDPQVAGERIRARPIRRQLVAALDGWANTRRALHGEGWRQRLAVARAADPVGQRNRLRDYLEGKDRKALEEAVTTEYGDDWEALTLLAEVAWRTPSAERVASLLRQVQQRHPGEFWINENLGVLQSESRPPRLDEAIRFLGIAVALRPQSPGAHVNLGKVLKRQDRLDEAIAEFGEAVRLKEDFPTAHFDLGHALGAAGRTDEALDEYRKALDSKPDYPQAHTNLGNILHDKGLLDEAINEFRAALRSRRSFPEAYLAHANLANALRDKGLPDEAIAEYRNAIHLKKDYAEAHCNLGAILCDIKHDYDAAIAEFRDALIIKPDLAKARHNLGVALQCKGLLAEAIAEFQAARRINEEDPLFHYSLGRALKQNDQLERAIDEYRAALKLKKDYAEAHCNLGNALLQKGEFRQAVEELRRGHELGSRNPRWPHPSARWLRDAERLADLDARLPALLQSKEQPKDAGERLALAQLCQEHKKLFAAATRWYGEAFAAQAALADDPSSGQRYNAACAAALAGCGQGQDAGRLSDPERAGLRKQARDWLQADLEAWRRLLEKEPARNGTVAEQMLHWLEDPDFAGVRGDRALAGLPAAERADWQQLWREVAALRQRAADPQDKAAAGRP